MHTCLDSSEVTRPCVTSLQMRLHVVWVTSCKSSLAEVIEVLHVLLSPSFTNRSDWPCESLPPPPPPPLHPRFCACNPAEEHGSSVRRNENPGQRSASPPSHTVIKTATCSRGRENISLCQMKATYSLMCSCDQNWQQLKGQHTAAQLNHGRKQLHRILQ